MERELFMSLLRTATDLAGANRRPLRAAYTNLNILTVLLWAALNDRPISWAVDRKNWPLCLRRRPLPSSATMSRRLRDPVIALLINELITRLHVDGDGQRTLIIDGRPLTIANHSVDHDAGFGRAVGGVRRGYKLHMIADLLGNCRAFVVQNLRVSEQTAACQLIVELPPGEHDQLLADANYDSNELYELAGSRGVQMLAARRYRNARSIGHRRHSVHRLRGLQIMASDPSCLDRRRVIEGMFGTQGNVIGGLGPLPNHVRRLRRVRLWVAAKLAIDAAHRRRRTGQIAS